MIAALPVESVLLYSHQFMVVTFLFTYIIMSRFHHIYLFLSGVKTISWSLADNSPVSFYILLVS